MDAGGQRIISKGFHQQWRSATGHLEPYNGSGGIFEDKKKHKKKVRL